jgi:hypothetical protein
MHERQLNAQVTELRQQPPGLLQGPASGDGGSSRPKSRLTRADLRGRTRKIGSEKISREIVPKRSWTTASRHIETTMARPAMKNQPSVTIVTPTAP